MIRRTLSSLVFAALLLGHGTAHALELELPPDASLSREIANPVTRYGVPTGPFDAGRLPITEVEGAVLSQAWQFNAPGLTALQIMRPLREQVAAAGYEVVLDCEGQACGGFDFRYRIDVMPAPDMFVDLFNYHFIVARQASEGTAVSYLTLLVSRVGSVGYLQITRVTQNGDLPPSVNVVTSTAEPPRTASSDSLVALLQSSGHVVLSDLQFETGSGDLGPGPYPSLTVLAAFLNEDTSRRVALVGHTDAVGGLSANLTLSRRRAVAVRQRLVVEYSVAPDQLEADGAGYLAPVASNLTPAGREQNRRVEAVLLNTE